MENKFVFDRNSGEIEVNDSFKITPNSSMSDFLKNVSDEFIKFQGGGGHLIELKPMVMNGVEFRLICVFSRKPECFKLLKFIELIIYDPKNTGGWENYSLESEMAKRRSQESWLEGILGKPSSTEGNPNEAHMYRVQYDFNWGRVASFYDGRDGYSRIEVDYI